MSGVCEQPNAPTQPPTPTPPTQPSTTSIHPCPPPLARFFRPLDKLAETKRAEKERKEAHKAELQAAKDKKAQARQGGWDGGGE